MQVFATLVMSNRYCSETNCVRSEHEVDEPQVIKAYGWMQETTVSEHDENLSSCLVAPNLMALEIVDHKCSGSLNLGMLHSIDVDNTLMDRVSPEFRATVSLRQWETQCPQSVDNDVPCSEE